MRQALHAEISAGNLLAKISISDWPTPQSIVVTMCQRFTVARRTPPQGVEWRKVNDPHYWREELEQKVDERVFLAIT
jgi:hypothetical protein